LCAAILAPLFCPVKVRAAARCEALMSPAPLSTNTLFYGDNLPILRTYIADASVDLIYLDPPFNSSRNYNVLFRDERGTESQAQITAFEDTWHWGLEAEREYNDLVTEVGGEVGTMIGALRSFIGPSQMLAYLVMMAARLVELRRVLKPTGSLYLHCDPTASHYLKIVLDAIFGPERFLNEIVWKRAGAHNSAKRYGPVHDVILFYSKTREYIWNQQYQEQDDYIKKRYTYVDERNRQFYPVNLFVPGVRNGSSGLPWRGIDVTSRGSHWRYGIEKLDELDAAGDIYWPAKGEIPRLKMYLENAKGAFVQDWFDDITPINSQAAERLGYPTQKPMALLERIISASSNPGDLILDPFCGCGTAIAAAQKLGRRWAGIDVTHLSIALQKYRLEQSFPGIKFNVVGEPEDLGAARQLASDDRYQFQWWALSLVRARPLGGEAGSREGKKGSDKGIDGVITFLDDAGGKPKRALIQVKSGKVKSGDIRDLVGTVEREKAEIGVFVTLEEPSRDMIAEAAAAGLYRSPGWGRNFPKIQILTIAELLRGAVIAMPPPHGTFKQAQRVEQPIADQQSLDL
jgi:site-specific DNA-methyltransferase (adenine-specific)